MSAKKNYVNRTYFAINSGKFFSSVLHVVLVTNLLSDSDVLRSI